MYASEKYPFTKGRFNPRKQIFILISFLLKEVFESKKQGNVYVSVFVYVCICMPILDREQEHPGEATTSM